MLYDFCLDSVLVSFKESLSEQRDIRIGHVEGRFVMAQSISNGLEGSLVDFGLLEKHRDFVLFLLVVTVVEEHALEEEGERYGVFGDFGDVGLPYDLLGPVQNFLNHRPVAYGLEVP